MTTVEQLVNDFQHLGLERHDTVMMHSSFSKLGSIDGVLEGDRIALAKAFTGALDQVLEFDVGGAIVVPSFTYNYARNGVPFVYEESPADPALGFYSEYIRTRPDAQRSMHPVFSVSAIGAEKGRICIHVSRTAYGSESPFDRLYKVRGKILLLGVGYERLTYLHHIEHMAGVSHMYHKAFRTPVYRRGKQDLVPYTAFVRYLNGKVQWHPCRFEAMMQDKGWMNKGRVGGADAILLDCRILFDVGFKALQKDPCMFIREPYYHTE